MERFSSFFLLFRIFLLQYAAAISGTYNLTTSKSLRQLYIYDLTTNETTTISLNYTGAHDLCWSPQSNIILFVIDNSNSTSSVILFSLVTKEYMIAATYPVSISTLRWAETGTILTFTASVYPGKSLEETRALDDAKEQDDGAQFMQFDKTMVYHWDTYITDKRTHIFYSNVTEDSGNQFLYSINTSCIDILGSVMADSPTYPTGLITLFL